MKKNDLLTHLSFFAVLMTMAVLPAPVDAWAINLSYAESQAISAHSSGQVYSNHTGLMEYEFVSADIVSSETGSGHNSLLLSDVEI